MTWNLSSRDTLRLQGVHPDLIKVINQAVKNNCPRFAVIEGLRTLDRQKKLVASGASKTMKSRHLTGHAFDIAPLEPDGDISWAWPLYKPLAVAIKKAAQEVGVSIEWGGDWKSFKDGPHWQLSWTKYPK